MREEPNMTNGRWGTCAVCHRVMRVYVPSKGDGTLRLPYAHKKLVPKSLLRAFPRYATCKGAFEAAVEWS